MAGNRVVITGLGVFSALGKNSSEFWQNAINGKSAIKKIDVEGAETLKFEYGAQITDYQAKDFLSAKEIILNDTFAQYFLIAANEAINHSKIDFSKIPEHRVGVITGTSIGGQGTHDDAFKTVYFQRKERVNPLTIPRIMPNAGTSAICMKYGFRGPSYTVTTACASSNHAISNAYKLVKDGTCDVMVTGGGETPFSYGFLRAWDAIRVISPDTCKPFDANRKGMILGEGAGILILENLESALARDAHIYGEIIGVGMTADAGHITSPDIRGVRLSIEMALKDAGISEADVSHINAHGTGTQANDIMEATVIKEIFKDKSNKIPVTATKSLHGHGLGASSSFEAILTILTIHNSLIPPTVNTSSLDEEIDIDLVISESRKAEIDIAISNSFAFGGLNSVVVFKKYSD